MSPDERDRRDAARAVAVEDDPGAAHPHGRVRRRRGVLHDPVVGRPSVSLTKTVSSDPVATPLPAVEVEGSVPRAETAARGSSRRSIVELLRRGCSGCRRRTRRCRPRSPPRRSGRRTASHGRPPGVEVGDAGCASSARSRRCRSRPRKTVVPVTSRPVGLANPAPPPNVMDERPRRVELPHEVVARVGHVDVAGAVGGDARSDRRSSPTAGFHWKAPAESNRWIRLLARSAT